MGDARVQKLKGFGPNIIAEKVVDDRCPTIILNAHMDTVKPWKGGLEPKVKGDRLYGTGAADMKAGLAIIIETFRRSNLKKTNLTFTAVVDEEGNSYGAYRLLKDMKLKGDLCLIPEPSNEMPVLGARGRIAVDIELRSTGAHGARPDEGVNTIEEGAMIISSLARMQFKIHRLLGKGSVCAYRIEGGGDELSVPSSCNIRVDRHYVPGEEKKGIMNDLKGMVRSLKLKSDVEIAWIKRPTPFLEPYVTERTPLVSYFLSQAKRFYGQSKIRYAQSVGDYNLFARRMPTIIFGPGGKYWHTSREYVNIASVKRCFSFYERCLNAFDTQKKKY